MPGRIVVRVDVGRWVSANRRTLLDGLVERPPDPRLERVAGRAEVGAFEDQSAVGPAATDPLVGLADRRVAARTHVGERRPRTVTDRRLRHGAAPDERVAVADCPRIAGRGRTEVEPAQADGRGRHGTIFSIGSTRIPDAPAALSRGRRPQTSSAPTTEWIAIMPSWASGMIVGDSRAGSRPSSSASIEAGAFIIRYLRPRAAMTALSIVSMAASSDDRSRSAVGFATRIASDARTSPIWRSPFMTRVEPVETRSTMPSARPEPRRDLDRARDRDDVHGDAARLEEATGRVRVGRGDPQAGQVLDGLLGRVGGDGGRQPATAVAEGPDARQLGAGLGQQVDAGDAEVGHAVADELDDVVRAHEQDVEVEVLDARDQAPVVLLEHEARVVQEPQGRFDEPALVRDGQPEAFPHRSVPALRPLEDRAVAALAVVQPRGDAGDRRRAGARLARDLGVVLAAVEQPDDRPALGHVAQLVERAEVAEEALRFGGILQTEDRLEERLGVRGSPVVGHVAVLASRIDRVVLS